MSAFNRQLFNTFLSIFFCSIPVFAQLSISESDILALRETSRPIIVPNQDTISAFIEIGDAGMNQTWDFRIMDTTSSIIGVQEFINSSEGYQSELFPQANFTQRTSAETSEGNIIIDSYFKVTPDYFSSLGTASNIAGFSNLELVQDDEAPLPITYLTNWIAVSLDTSDQIGFLTITNDTTWNSIDASGLLRLPSGDFEALRLKQVSKTITTTSFNGTPFSVDTVESLNYTWLTKNHLQTLTVDVNEDNIGQVSFMISDAATSVNDISLIKNSFQLDQNYPNPFNPSTIIRYTIPENVNVDLRVYDILGNEIDVLENQMKNAGSYSVRFDGSNLSTGVYFYTLRAGDFVGTKKLLLIK